MKLRTFWIIAVALLLALCVSDAWEAFPVLVVLMCAGTIGSLTIVTLCKALVLQAQPDSAYNRYCSELDRRAKARDEAGLMRDKRTGRIVPKPGYRWDSKGRCVRIVASQ